MSTEPTYVAAHVHEAVATDTRTGAQDVQAAIVAGRVVLTGTCATQERKEAITVVAREAADGMEIVNEVEVLAPAAPSTREELS